MQYVRLSFDENGTVKAYIVLLIPFSWLSVMLVLSSKAVINPLFLSQSTASTIDNKVTYCVIKWFFCLQAKPFISEAHVFNDAGLSFDVWAPETGLASAQPSTRETGVADSSHNLSYGDGMHKITANQQPLVGDSCSADIAIAVGTCPAGSHNESVGGQGGNEWTNTSPGYLLAVKLWQEAIATDAAASRNAEDIHSFIH